MRNFSIVGPGILLGYSYFTRTSYWENKFNYHAIGSLIFMLFKLLLPCCNLYSDEGMAYPY